MSYQLPYFGELNLKELDEYYDVDIELGGVELTVDINFDEESISIGKLNELRSHLENLPAILEKARAAIRESFEQGGDVMEYITHHLDLIKAPELQATLQDTDPSLSDEEKLFSLVYPVRIGLYPEDKEGYFTLDFSIGKEVTQYLIVVVMNANKELVYITMES